MREEITEESLLKIIRKRRREIDLYNRMLKTSDIRENQIHLITVRGWRRMAILVLELRHKELEELREEKRHPKYRWAD